MHYKKRPENRGIFCILENIGNGADFYMRKQLNIFCIRNTHQKILKENL